MKAPHLYSFPDYKEHIVQDKGNYGKVEQICVSYVRSLHIPPYILLNLYIFFEVIL